MASYATLARGRLHRTTLRANLLVLQARAPRSGISSSRTLPLRVSAFSPSAVEQSPQQCASLVAGALSKFRALVVDSSYRPIDILSWCDHCIACMCQHGRWDLSFHRSTDRGNLKTLRRERAICLDLYQKADVLEYYDVQASRYVSEFWSVCSPGLRDTCDLRLLVNMLPHRCGRPRSCFLYQRSFGSTFTLTIAYATSTSASRGETSSYGTSSRANTATTRTKITPA